MKMLKSRLLASVAAAALCLPIAALTPTLPLGVTAAQAQTAQISFQLFFDQLEPHGVWVRHARYNYVFCPTGVDAAWRPYTQGRWLYLADYGWYFASEEPFAWATYHYGRWFADRQLGWCWVPGTTWAPAWVSWRSSDNVIGWAPLPPEGEDITTISIEVSRRELPQGYWVFVPVDRFIEPQLSVNIVFGNQEPQFFTETQFLGPVQVEGDLVVNNVIDVTHIEQTINQEIIIYNVEEAPEPGTEVASTDTDTVQIFTADIEAPAEDVAPPEAVPEEEAAQVIESEGGTVSGAAEIEAEGEATPPAEGTVEGQESTETGTEVETAPTEDAAPADTEAAPTEETAPAEEAAPAEETAPAEDAAPVEEAAPAEEQPADATEAPCPPDQQMVDGVCQPLATEGNAATGTDTQTEAPAPEATAPAGEPAAPEAAAPDAAPAPTEQPANPEQPAATDSQAPAEEPAPAEEAAPAEAEPAPPAGDEPLVCPPEQIVVEGRCVPAEQAQ